MVMKNIILNNHINVNHHNFTNQSCRVICFLSYFIFKNLHK